MVVGAHAVGPYAAPQIRCVRLVTRRRPGADWTESPGCRRPDALCESGQLAGSPEDLIGHLLGQPTGERVLLARVVAAQQGCVLGAVAEARTRADRRLAGGDAEAE